MTVSDASRADHQLIPRRSLWGGHGAACICAVYALLAACSSNGTDTGNTNPGVHDTMFAVAGDNQTVVDSMHGVLPIDPTVRITNASGQPVAGVPVSFLSQTPGITPSDTVINTDSAGTAAEPSVNMFYAGTAELQATAADVRGSPVTFTTTVLGYVLVNATSGVDLQQAPAGTAVAVAPQVQLFSPNGEGARGLRVVFRVISGGGTIADDTAVADDNQVATAGSWTLGPTPGVNKLRVVVLQTLGGDSTTITATGT